jgi:predicted 2-oxoglutarate/Fe(II)-dependent dioxygenase YbiX
MNHEWWHWSEEISPAKIKKINKTINTNLVVSEDHPASAKKTSTVKFVKYGDIKPLIRENVENCYIINSREFNFNLYYLQNPDVLNYNIYDKDSEYGWHIDAQPGHVEDIKLTVLINLSDEPYEGGEFEIWNGSGPVIVSDFSKPGDIIMFRSHFLHRVRPVKKGKRKTLSIFMVGPRWQ